MGTQSQEFCAVLEGGKKIVLSLTPRWELDKLLYLIEITYQESIVKGIAAGWSRWLEHLQVPRLGMTRPAFGFISVLIGLIAITLIAVGLLSRIPNRQKDLAKQDQSNLDPKGAGAPTPGTDSSLPGNPILPRPPTTRTGKGLRAIKTGKPGATRERSPRASRSLLSVEKIYVQSLGDDAFSLSIREKLINTLRRSTRFVITDVPDTADSAITGVVRQIAGNRNMDPAQNAAVGNVRAEILNVSGEVIWRTKVYKGSADQIAEWFTDDLLEAIQTEEQRKKVNPPRKD